MGLCHEWLEGHEFVDYRLIGIPVYRLITDSIFLARTPLSSLQSFILRVVGMKLSNTEEIAMMLGLDINTTEKVVGVFKADALIRTRCVDSARSVEVLELTSRGHEVLKEDGSVAPQERTEFIEYEGWLRKPIRIRPDSLFSARQILEQGGLIMPSIPSKPPRLAEVSIAEVEAVLRSRDALDSGERLLEMKRIVRRLLKYRAGIGIVHRRMDSNELRLAIILTGGAPSEEHGWAFASAGYLKRTDLIHGVRSGPIRRRMRECVGEEAWSCCISTEEFTIRRRELFGTMRRRESIRLSLAIEEGVVQRKVLESELVEASESAAQAAMALEDLRVRPVSPLEYATLLMDALRFAETAVLVDTVRVESVVLRVEILDLMESKLKEGVRVVIRCNQNLEGKMSEMAPAVGRLVSFRKYGGFSIISRPRNAVFFLVRDDTFALLTNRPLLCTNADRDRFFCQMGYLITDSKLTGRVLKSTGPVKKG